MSEARSTTKGVGSYQADKLCVAAAQSLRRIGRGGKGCWLVKRSILVGGCRRTSSRVVMRWLPGEHWCGCDLEL